MQGNPEECQRSVRGGAAVAWLAAGQREAGSGSRAPEQTMIGPSFGEVGVNEAPVHGCYHKQRLNPQQKKQLWAWF